METLENVKKLVTKYWFLNTTRLCLDLRSMSLALPSAKTSKLIIDIDKMLTSSNPIAIVR